MKLGRQTASVDGWCGETVGDSSGATSHAMFPSNILHTQSAAQNLSPLRQNHRSLNSDYRLILRNVVMRRDRTDRQKNFITEVAALNLFSNSVPTD